MARNNPRSNQHIDNLWRRETARAGRGRYQPIARPPHRRSRSSILLILCIGLSLGWYAPEWLAWVRPAPQEKAPATAAIDLLSARFAFCHTGGGTNCVVDGDTFWFRGDKYRIADIDTPETHGPRCAQEGALGARATQRLQDLLNVGPFSLEHIDRDTDKYQRSLRIVTRNGQSIGEQLVAEGLARRWDGGRHPWC